MSANAPRRLNLVDVMTLIVFLAIGLAGKRYTSTGFLPYWGWSDSRQGAAVWLARALTAMTNWSPVIALLGVGALALRLRAPRPSMRRLGRQPGFVALIANAFGTVVTIPSIWAMFQRGSSLGGDLYIPYSSILGMSYAVGAAWTVLWTTQGWRRATGVFDWFGITVGYYWLAFILGAFLV